MGLRPSIGGLHEVAGALDVARRAELI
jgi:hypothetical protein